MDLKTLYENIYDYSTNAGNTDGSCNILETPLDKGSKIPFYLNVSFEYDDDDKEFQQIYESSN
jgi:hypothetical protein